MPRFPSPRRRFTWLVCELTEYGGFESTDAFCEQFEQFLDRPRDEKMKLLSEIRT